MMSWPKPAQRPHPPIIVGGTFPYGARVVVSLESEKADRIVPELDRWAKLIPSLWGGSALR